MSFQWKFTHLIFVLRRGAVQTGSYSCWIFLTLIKIHILRAFDKLPKETLQGLWVLEKLSELILSCPYLVFGFIYTASLERRIVTLDHELLSSIKHSFSLEVVFRKNWNMIAEELVVKFWLSDGLSSKCIGLASETCLKPARIFWQKGFLFIWNAPEQS